MRSRPEPTQLEHLSDASLLGKLLVLSTNVRLDWKVNMNALAYLASSSATKEKSFITMTPSVKVIKHLFLVTDGAANLAGAFILENHSSLV